MPLRGLILIAFFVASLPICFVRPLYGVCLWMIVAFLNPQAYTWSTAADFPWALAVAVPTLAGLCFFKTRDWPRVASIESLMIVMLWIWFTITSVISTNTPLFMHHAADTWYRWGFVSKILLMTLAMIPLVNTFERLRIVLLTVAGCFGVYVAKMFPFIISSGGQHRLYGPPNSMIADNNDFGLALNMTLPLFFFLAQAEERPWVKRLFGVLFVITIPAIFFTYSRGAVLGLVILSILMILRLKQRLLLIPVLLAGVMVAMLFAPESWKDRMDPTKKGAMDASAQSRITAWTFAWNLAGDYPATGGGFATFTPQLFSRYSPSMDIHGAHSVYFQLLGEHGFVGLGLYLTLVGICMKSTGKVIRLAKQRNDRTVLLYANMLRFSMIGFLVPGFFLGRAYFDYYFTIVASIVILKKGADDRWAEWDAEEEAMDEEEESVDPHLPGTQGALAR